MPSLLRHHPLTLLQSLRYLEAVFRTPARAREFLLDAEAEEQTVARCVAQVGPESGTVLSQVVRAKPRPVQTAHVLFLAARADRLAAPSLVGRSAEAMYASCHDVAGPHMMHLARTWEEGAEEVLWFAREAVFPRREPAHQTARGSTGSQDASPTQTEQSVWLLRRNSSGKRIA